ncbi:hypothetical protein N7495_006154 [Penicillium taxi]|uniref:uncharacterized protein n=1 Tax=Penicillium taxi TaxID=168475 RepID=UPI0025452FB0|nr:uncharacterized protein N7495_006154 [Penicillium taxi]KAJ5894463.1 hypothetical protein N7495_006154 [Penicillium taxi]
MDPSNDIESDSDEYEYEYHESEKETFFLNLDLTSIHGPLRAPRQRSKSPHENSTQENQDPDNPGNHNDQNGTNDDNPDEVDKNNAYASIEGTPGDRIQILGLHEDNPVVTYHNQVFSCSWADQIGTELIFTTPETSLDTAVPLHQGPGYQLVTANSVKILGRKSNLMSSAGTLFELQGAGPSFAIPVADDADLAPRAFGTRRTAQTPQTHFIRHLQNIKDAKGQTDTVRVVMKKQSNMAITDRLNSWARTEAQMARVQMLTKRAAEGDDDALESIEDILDELDEWDEYNAQL